MFSRRFDTVQNPKFYHYMCYCQHEKQRFIQNQRLDHASCDQVRDFNVSDGLDSQTLVLQTLKEIKLWKKPGGEDVGPRTEPEPESRSVHPVLVGAETGSRPSTWAFLTLPEKRPNKSQNL